MIIQTWISTYFRVLSEQLPAADENLVFIKATFTSAPVLLQGPFDHFFQLATLQKGVNPEVDRPPG